MFEAKRTGLFFFSWLCHPLQTGAVAPSGRSLARAMARTVDPASPKPVIELGPGTGALTAAILETGLPREQLILVEMNPRFCEILRDRYPGVRVICGDAASLVRLLPGDARRVQAVISGVPLLTMPRRIQESILAQSLKLLGDEGPFVQFTYSLGSPVPRALTAAVGFRGRRVAHVWNNLPPASVWHFTPATARAGNDGSRLTSRLLTSPEPAEPLAAGFGHDRG